MRSLGAIVFHRCRYSWFCLPGNYKIAALDRIPACMALSSLLMIMGACSLDTSIHVLPPAEVVAQLAKKNKKVVTFLGYSGAQYEDPAALQTTIEQLLLEFDPADTIVNSGATAIGIGAVYASAKRMGFATSGIVSTHRGLRSFCARIVKYRGCATRVWSATNTMRARKNTYRWDPVRSCRSGSKAGKRQALNLSKAYSS